MVTTHDNLLPHYDIDPGDILHFCITNRKFEFITEMKKIFIKHFILNKTYEN